MAYMRFHKGLAVAPGVRVNVSKSGPSLSLGPNGARVNIGPQGVRTTLGLPGSGVSVINRTSWSTMFQPHLTEAVMSNMDGMTKEQQRALMVKTTAASSLAGVTAQKAAFEAHIYAHRDELEDADKADVQDVRKILREAIETKEVQQTQQKKLFAALVIFGGGIMFVGLHPPDIRIIFGSLVVFSIAMMTPVGRRMMLLFYASIALVAVLAICAGVIGFGALLIWAMATAPASPY